jgi:hypothetical protein
MVEAGNRWRVGRMQANEIGGGEAVTLPEQQNVWVW